MPGDVHGGVDECGGENRAGLAPRPPVEKAGNGGQDHVAPVWETHVGDVREAEENRSGPPAGKIAMGSARKQVLEQAAEEKLFGPSGEEENAERNERQRLQLRPLWFKLNEMYELAQWNGDAPEGNEACCDEEAPMAAPADRIADPVDAAEKQEARECDVDAKEHGENVG